jgi:opacity protein-like surface antigen
MKKSFLYLSLIFAFISSAAFAKENAGKTEGSYLSIDGVITESNFYSRTEYKTGRIAKGKPTNSNEFAGLGLSYRYAFNFNNFFIAPGLIFEQNSFGSSRNKDKPDALSLQIQNRFGFKTDFGYDLTKNIAPYLTGGYAVVKYKTTASGESKDFSLVKAGKSDFEGSFFFGGGFKFDLANNFSLNLEYNYQKFDASATVPVESSDLASRIIYPTSLNIIKLGLAYNF